MYVCDLRFSTCLFKKAASHNQARFDWECVISCTVRSLRKKHEHSREGDVSQPGCVCVCTATENAFGCTQNFDLFSIRLNTVNLHSAANSVRDVHCMSTPFFKFLPLWRASFSRKAIVRFTVWKKKKEKKSLLGKMSLTLVHGGGNGGWHIQYRETVRAKYLCQPDSFTVKRWGWRVHLGLDLNAACCGLQVLASFFFL